MLYNEQLVLTGELDDVGSPIRTNSGSSYRLGVEAEASIKLSKEFSINSNITLSSNKNKEILSQFDGQIFNFGKTNISFSPKIITSNSIVFTPNTNFTISLLSKYVGKQYMSNTDAVNSILDSYFVNNLNFSYKISSNTVFNEIIISGLINNVFDKEYISNGYYYTYDDTWSIPGQVKTLDGAGYYPQATRNFLLGLSLKF
jgi:iron complex outermembrane receptor protein